LLYLTKAIDYYDLRELSGSESEYLFVSFTSDWLYPSHQSERLHAMAKAQSLTSEHFLVDLPYGHDGFLLDGEIQGAVVRTFLS